MNAARPPRSGPDFLDYLNDDRWNWWFVALTAVAVLLAAIALLCTRPSSLWDGIDTVDTVIGMATYVAVLLGWYSSVRKGMESQRQIEIVLEHDGGQLRLPFRPLRSHLSRNEIMGIVGAYYGELRFPPEEIRGVWEAPPGGESALNHVLKGRSDQLVIPVKSRDVFDRIRSGVQPAPATP